MRRPVVKIGIAVTASALFSAGAASLLTAGSSGPVVLPYATMAAINTSNTTVGFADSDIIGMSQADIDRTLDEMQAMGVQNVRILIPWNGIELADDFFYWNKVDALVNSAYERDMGILGVLNSTPAWATEPGQPAPASPPADTAEYAEFVGAVADRYAGKVSAYEVWNEPNYYKFWEPTPDAAAYTALLKVAYGAIKAADPNAVVVGGVIAAAPDSGTQAIDSVRYVTEMYEAGAAGYFDALSFHPYSIELFSAGASVEGSPLVMANQIHEVMTAYGDGNKKIWATEYGMPTVLVTEAGQATYIDDFLSTWRDLDYAGPAYIHTVRDLASLDLVQGTFGVYHQDWTEKPAVNVIEAVIDENEAFLAGGGGIEL